MNDDPASKSRGAPEQAASPAENSNLSHPEAAPVQLSSPEENGNLAKLQKSREFTSKEMASLARTIGEIQAELAHCESRLEETKLIGPDREKFRVQRNGLRDRLEALREAQDAGQRRLAGMDLLLQGDAAENALATRRGTQGAALIVADQIRDQIAQVAELWQRFQVLRREDEQLRDVVRSVDQARMTEVTTFSWTTGVDQTFAAAIAEVVAQSQRSTRDLHARSPVAIVR